MERPWNTDANPALLSQKLRPLAALFPLVEASDVQAVLDLISVATSWPLEERETPRPPDFFSKDVCLITWRGRLLALPYRVYFQEPALEQWQLLTKQQRQVLHCLYLRHHDGYLRQRHLEALLALSSGSPADFTTPFTFSLLGEYVQEILAVLAVNLTPTLLAHYVALIKENPLYWQQTRGRVASYWDSYYRSGRRGAPRFQHYVGARLLAYLQKALQQAAVS